LQPDVRNYLAELDALCSGVMGNTA
jgi:hypothetical protein